jgi:hypothetical protein
MHALQFQGFSDASHFVAEAMYKSTPIFVEVVHEKVDIIVYVTYFLRSSIKFLMLAKEISVF